MTFCLLTSMTSRNLPLCPVLAVIALVAVTARGVAEDRIPPGVVVATSPEPEAQYIGSPSIAILADGSYVSSHDFFGQAAPAARSTRVFSSRDRGASWAQRSQFSGATWGSLFVHRGALYHMAITREYGDVIIRRSTDGGRTWTTPTDAPSGVLFKGKFHSAPVPVVVHNGRIWRAVEEVVNEKLWPRHFAAVVLCAPEGADLLQAKNWVRTNGIAFDEAWAPGRRPGWLEGNVVVSPEGGIVNLLRVNMEVDATAPFSVRGIPRYEVAARTEVSGDGRELSFQPECGIFQLPGSQSKFTIRFDPVSRRYWSLVNKITLAHEDRAHEVSPIAQRNVVMLISSSDLKEWREHAKVLRWRDGEKLARHDRYAFQYLDWQVEGDDLVAVSRTSWNAQSFHNANALTFHRVRNFRRLTMADSAPDLAAIVQRADADRASALNRDIMRANFEGPSFGGWKVTGTAFGRHPARGLAAGRSPGVTGYAGSGFASSAASPATDGALRGALESPEFALERDYINFLIGGGNHAFRAAISLWIDGRVVRTTTGNDSDQLEWATWDVREFRGRRAWLGIYDQCIEDERPYVLVDEITWSDSARNTPGGDVAKALIQVGHEAVQAIRRKAARAAADPLRPIYHYAPPAQRMNDPNGPAWANGYHHVFYQHMVFEGAGPAIDVHWGHARSRDLVNWETLPLAIHPAYELGELSCFSGNLAWDKGGEPVQFVTMVPYKKNTPRQIWPARPLDAEWIRWERIPEKPPAGLVAMGDPTRDLKDAFPFAAGGRRFLVLTDKRIPIYEATDERLTTWVHRGLLDEQSAECPNFFEVDGHWVYLASPHEPVRYRIGDFDPATCKFTMRTEGRINHDAGFYASTAYRDDKGRTILLGVSKGQKSSPAWTGVLALPRVLSIGSDLRPRMHPVADLATLRREPFRMRNAVTLENRAQLIAGLSGDAMEISARFKAGTASSFGLRVRRSDDGRRSLPVMWKNAGITVGRETPKFPCAYEIDPETREIVFRIFLDKGMLDACTGEGRVFESRVHSAPVSDLGVEAFAEGGSATLVSLEAWRMAPAKIVHESLWRAE